MKKLKTLLDNFVLVAISGSLVFLIAMYVLQTSILK